MDNQKITFEKKPIPIPAEYRPMYQIAIVVLVLKFCCRSNTSSLQKLHLFSWCCYSKKNMATLQCYLENSNRTPAPHWTIDPALNRALNYAVADGFCELTSNNKYKLASKGAQLFAKIDPDNDLFYHEKIFLKQIGKRLTDEMVDRLTVK